MASNWRFNCWLLGCDYAGPTLMARLVVNPAIYLSNLPHNLGGKWGFSQPVPGVDFWERMFQILPPGPNPHFPYGVDVDPD